MKIFNFNGLRRISHLPETVVTGSVGSNPPGTVATGFGGWQISTVNRHSDSVWEEMRCMFVMVRKLYSPVAETNLPLRLSSNERAYSEWNGGTRRVGRIFPLRLFSLMMMAKKMGADTRVSVRFPRSPLFAADDIEKDGGRHPRQRSFSPLASLEFNFLVK